MIAYIVVTPWLWLTLLLLFGVAAGLLSDWFLSRRRRGWSARRRALVSAVPGPIVLLVLAVVLVVFAMLGARDGWGPAIAAALVQIALVAAFLSFSLGLMVAGLAEWRRQ